MVFAHYLTAAFTVATLAGTPAAIDLDITNEQSIKNAAATAAFNAMSYYTGNQTGQIPGKINHTWWEGGVLFDTMIRYWYFTDDASNNAAVSQGMYHQRGAGNDYMPSNWSSYIANDDQMAWGLAAMTAAELNYPEDAGMPSWVDLAERVFDVQAARWDNNTCSGGLRWQLWPYQAGYAMKNAMSNGGLFQLAARLARYTNNQTYVDWANTIWDWSTSHLVQEGSWNVADSTNTENDCTTLGNNQWSYNYGVFLSGAAYMYNYTNGETKWKTGLDGLLNTTLGTFFPHKYGGEIMSEILCEPTQVCNDDEIIFKGLLAESLTFTSMVAPYTSSDILPRLQGSAVGAAKQCSGGSSKTTCGQRWYQSTWDGTEGIEEELSATSIFTSNLVVYKHQSLATKATATNGTSGSTGTESGNGTTTASTTAGSNSVVPTNGANSFAYGPLGVAAAILAGVVAIA